MLVREVAELVWEVAEVVREAAELVQEGIGKGVERTRLVRKETETDLNSRWIHARWEYQAALVIPANP